MKACLRLLGVLSQNRHRRQHHCLLGPWWLSQWGRRRRGSRCRRNLCGNCYYELGIWRGRICIPSFEYPVPLHGTVSNQSHYGCPQAARSLLVHDNGGGLGRHLCYCLRGSLEARSNSGVPTYRRGTCANCERTCLRQRSGMSGGQWMRHALKSATAPLRSWQRKWHGTAEKTVTSTFTTGSTHCSCRCSRSFLCKMEMSCCHVS